MARLVLTGLDGTELVSQAISGDDVVADAKQLVPCSEEKRSKMVLLRNGRRLRNPKEPLVNDAGHAGMIIDLQVLFTDDETLKACAACKYNPADDDYECDYMKLPRVFLKCCGARVCGECNVMMTQTESACPDCGRDDFDITTCTFSDGAMTQKPEGFSLVVEAPTPAETACTPFTQWMGTPPPRPYQVESYRAALERNTIINLGTGLGKTHVAVMLIDKFLEQEPCKMICFAVPTTALVDQQAQYVRKYSTVPGIRVKELTRAPATEAEWQAQLTNCQVLVGVHERLRRGFIHGFLQPAAFSLAIFDECHHAKGNHPYVGIVADRFKAAEQSPRIVGLTASFCHGKARDLPRSRQELEANLDATIYTPGPASLPRDAVDQSMFSVPFTKDSEFLSSQALMDHFDALTSVLRHCFDLEEFDKRREKYSKTLQHIGEVLGISGGWLWLRVLGQETRAVLEDRELKVETEEQKRQIRAILVAHKDQLSKLSALVEALKTGQTWRSPGQRGISHKFHALCMLLDEKLQSDTECHVLVFVERTVTAVVLTELLSEWNASMPVTYTTGDSSKTSRAKALKHLGAEGDRVLVATASLEEGIDVPVVNNVIRFDKFHSVRQHVQGKGRARASKSWIYYFETDPEAMQEEAEKMQAVAEDRAWEVLDGNSRADEQIENPVTGAVLNVFNAPHILHDFIARKIAKLLCLPDGIDFTSMELDFGFERNVAVRGEDVDSFWRKQGFVNEHALKEKLGPRAANWQAGEARFRKYAFLLARQLQLDGYLSDHNLPSGVRKHPDHVPASLPMEFGSMLENMCRTSTTGKMAPAVGSGDGRQSDGLSFPRSQAQPPPLDCPDTLQSSNLEEPEVERRASTSPEGFQPCQADGNIQGSEDNAGAHLPLRQTNWVGKLSELCSTIPNPVENQIQYAYTTSNGDLEHVSFVTVRVLDGSHSFKGEPCSSKKMAKQSAAELAFKQIREIETLWDSSTPSHMPCRAHATRSEDAPTSSARHAVAATEDFEKLVQSVPLERLSSKVALDMSGSAQGVESITAVQSKSGKKNTMQLESEPVSTQPTKPVLSDKAIHQMSSNNHELTQRVDEVDKPKGMLDQLMKKVLGKPVKSEVSYQQEQVAEQMFKSTVTLAISLGNQQNFTGAAKASKKAADQDAARCALKQCSDMSTLLLAHLPKIAASESEPEVCTHHAVEADPKGRLAHLMQRHLRKPVSAEVKYDTKPADQGFLATVVLKLSAGREVSFSGNLASTSKKDAEKDAAVCALRECTELGHWSARPHAGQNAGAIPQASPNEDQGSNSCQSADVPAAPREESLLRPSAGSQPAKTLDVEWTTWLREDRTVSPEIQKIMSEEEISLEHLGHLKEDEVTELCDGLKLGHKAELRSLYKQAKEAL